ncbi:MAG TPA: hypothetical protein VGF95_13910 [Solirubrobacteraceae bacterium]|jgi:DNA-3-methyladenine glycosylase II/AraC family transcriptional regulator of adaptative response / DNA-3-methyladenine glycosylase II
MRVSVEVQPTGPFRLPLRGGLDGVLRCRGGVLQRLLHHEQLPVIVAAAQPAHDRVALVAEAPSREAALHGIERMRFALGLDVDVAAFLRRFQSDPVIGASLRRRPWLRVARRPAPFEALAWAICEQLIEYKRAAAIERKIVLRLGRGLTRRDATRSGLSALRDLPAPATLAGVSPALLQSFDLGGARARALVKVAGEVASGRIDLEHPDHERTWRRLRAIRGIGAWTVEMLALQGQGREDQVPAGDVGLLRYVGRLLSGGDPRAFAEEHEVRSFFAPYGEWAGLAVAHVIG